MEGREEPCKGRAKGGRKDERLMGEGGISEIRRRKIDERGGKEEWL